MIEAFPYSFFIKKCSIKNSCNTLVFSYLEILRYIRAKYLSLLRFIWISGTMFSYYHTESFELFFFFLPFITFRSLCILGGAFGVIGYHSRKWNRWPEIKSFLSSEKINKCFCLYFAFVFNLFIRVIRNVVVSQFFLLFNV